MSDPVTPTPPAAPAAPAPAPAPAPSGAPVVAPPPAGAPSPAPASATAAPVPPPAVPTAPKPPEKYELKLPEGTKLPPSRTAQIEAFAKEKGLSQEQAQFALERDARFHDELLSAHEKQVETWKEQLRVDPDFGGHKYEETVDLAHRAAKQFFDEATFKEIFEDLRYGWHPGLAKGLARIGKQLAPAAFVHGGSATAAKSDAELFYGKKA